ncbi:hypothetical protein [Chryseobacterium lathyri]|uniref:hypothetical protein n=1 Tax=Chryseobacterium lathyri TaxID=395933 RepID=UPI00278B2B2F|nr:hypothetical protein [Chryseobacterium lathyri]MDQ0067742.1 hypothetical protein [Chryseobacterium lathyri]
MKTIVIALLILTFARCTKHKNMKDKVPAESQQNSSSYKANRNSKYYTKLNTIVIATEIGDTLQFKGKDFNKIIDNHGEFLFEIPENPDYLYREFGNRLNFGSERGKDEYYILYAYFVKQKNGIEKYSDQRKKLIDIYSNINTLFSYIQYGGTYFGHQQLRILGYAEYSIYLYSRNNDNIQKTYDISKQKALYIKSLRQVVDDEINIDHQTSDQQKADRSKKMNTLIDKLNEQITNNFYLQRAQAFHYGNYEYY